MLKRPLTKPTLEQHPSDQPSAVAVSRGGAARQDTLRNIGLIVRQEFKRRVTQRSFIISTIILLLIIVIAAFVPTVIRLITAHSNSNSQTKTAIVNNVGNIGGLSEDALNRYINTTLNGANGKGINGNAPFIVRMASAGDVDSLKQQVKKGSLDVLLVLNRTGQDISYTYYSTSDPANDSNISQVQTLASQLSLLDKSTRLGLTPTQTASLFAQPQFSSVNLGQPQSKRSVGDQVAGYILAYAGDILIFMAITLYGMGVAMGVAEEKGSRIMEILINAATPFQLMVGKIIGLGSAGLSQMALLVIVGIGTLLLQGPLQTILLGGNTGGLSLNITGSSIALLLLLLVYFILGFLLYATLFAALGALVKRQDEVQNTVQPLTLLLSAGYVAGIIGLSSPDSTWMRVISYVPFWTPTTMMVRIGVGNVAWWEMALTIVLMIVTIGVCFFIASRIYRFGVLMYGQRPGLRQLIKLVRQG